MFTISHHGALVVIAGSEMADKLPDLAAEDDKYWFQVLSKSTSSVKQHVFAMNSSPVSQPEANKIAKVRICWSPNNYESVTMEPAQLISPALVLEYKK